jgi:type II secretory pathway pseudopilin PulG
MRARGDRGQRGLTLVELMTSLALATMLGGAMVQGALLSMRSFTEAERRSSARQDLRRALDEVDRALRCARRDGVLAIRASFNGAGAKLAASTAGAALYLPQLTGFHATGSFPVYGDAVCFYVANDPAGGKSLYRADWSGTTDVTTAPSRTRRLAINVASLTPFLDDGDSVRAGLVVSRILPQGGNVTAGDGVEEAVLP